MSTHHQRLLAFSIKSRRVDGGPFVPHVVVECAGCGMRLEYPSQNAMNPEAIAKKIRSKGWEFDLVNESKSLCRECIAKRDGSRAGESPVVVTMLGKSVAAPLSLVPESALKREAAVEILKEAPNGRDSMAAGGKSRSASTESHNCTPAARADHAVRTGDRPDGPLREYEILIRSSLPLSRVVEAISDLGEVSSLRLVDRPKRGPGIGSGNYTRTPAMLERRRDTLHRRKTEYMERIVAAIGDIRRQQPGATAEEVAAAMNANAVPMCSGHPPRWTKRNINRFLLEYETRPDPAEQRKWTTPG